MVRLWKSMFLPRDTGQRANTLRRDKEVTGRRIKAPYLKAAETQFAGEAILRHDDHGKMTMSQRAEMKTKTIPAGVFKSKCLALMDEVQAKRETVVITKRGKPIAKLVPADSDTDDFYDSMKGKVRILGDIVGPIIPEEDWNLD